MLKHGKFHVTIVSLILLFTFQTALCVSNPFNVIPKLPGFFTKNYKNNENLINENHQKNYITDLQVGNDMEYLSPKFEHYRTGLLSAYNDYGNEKSNLMKLTAACPPKCDPCEPECEDRPIRLEIKSFKTVKPEAITGQRCVQFKECCCQNVPCKPKCVQRKCMRRCY